MGGVRTQRRVGLRAPGIEAACLEIHILIRKRYTHQARQIPQHDAAEDLRAGACFKRLHNLDRDRVWTV
jgi:hypothetical protein